jgi:hypothetical protein
LHPLLTAKKKIMAISKCRRPPQGVKEFRYFGTDTTNRYTAIYDFPDGGKNAYYMLRWENSRGQTRPMERNGNGYHRRITILH